MKKLLMVLMLCTAVLGFCPQEARAQDDVRLSDDASDFVVLTDVVPDAILEIRYFSTYNFVGDRIDGYHQPTALLTKEAALALKAVSDDVIKKGYRLKIFDAYRPQMAVSHFVRWAKDMGGTFDYFGQLSHPDYKKITKKQYKNRMILREAMLAHGFKPLVEEWWHFTLKDEPYPDTYFTFPVSEASVKRETKPAVRELKPAA